MSKGILNNRDKMIWDNTHKPDISDVVAEIDDEMDDLLDDHDDKVVDIVGDNMNDMLDAHDDKVVSIVGDNMTTLLTGAASTVQLLAGDLSGIRTTEVVKVGKWDATHDLYAFRATGDVGEITTGSLINLMSVNAGDYPVLITGYITSTEHIIPVNIYESSTRNSAVFFAPSTNRFVLRVGTYFSGGSYNIIVYFIRAITPTP